MDANALLREARDAIGNVLNARWRPEGMSEEHADALRSTHDALDAYLSQAPAGGAHADWCDDCKSYTHRDTCPHYRQHEAAAPPAAAVGQEPVAIAEVVESDDEFPYARVRWLLNPIPVGAQLCWMAELHAAPSVDEHLPEKKQ